MFFLFEGISPLPGIHAAAIARLRPFSDCQIIGQGGVLSLRSRKPEGQPNLVHLTPRALGFLRQVKQSGDALRYKSTFVQGPSELGVNWGATFY